MLVLLLLLISLFVSQAFAEQSNEVTQPTETPVLPGSEIWLFDIKQDGEDSLQLAAGKNFTQHKGYDSQPRFSNDGQVVFYTRQVIDSDNKQTDIYEYHLETGKTQPYMTTAESEYSASVDYEEPGITVVQVDAKGDQYVVHMNKEATEETKKVQRFSDLKQVGYFGWTSGYKFWSFVLNDAGGGDMVRIKSRQRKLHAAIDIMELLPAVEDFTVDAKGRFWAGKDQVLYVSTDQKTWTQVKDFSDEGLNGITRLTTNPTGDKIAIVFAEKDKSE